ncbi:MAG: exodeoxyribonuclease VII large subunit [Burkholderiales bacterium PBB6]|nr:MAG: exodeoxyribonuclease VII large subunit [Burkholderiales bacterium PBB6]
MSATGFNARSGAPAWSVSSLLLAVSDALAARFASVTVRGELSGLTRAASGHVYFTLKDANGAAAGLRCAMFRRSAQMLDFQPRDGQQVDVRGRLAVYEARGELQMVVESMQRVGAGSLYEEFLKLKARLEAMGLFAAERKRALPAVPQRVALVTSASGAALHDVLTSFRRRAPHVSLVLCPTLVQGAEAPPAIVAAMQAANRVPGAEMILLCRGGGSLEDLWAFNDERVVRSVADSDLPVVCGVGHETDVTLADLAADLRAATPTAAAELATPSRDDLLNGLQQRAAHLQRRVAQRLDAAAQRLDTVSLRLQRPAQAVRLQASRLDLLAQRHEAALRTAVSRAQQRLQLQGERLVRAGTQQRVAADTRLARQAVRLQALDPRQVLARGYAWMEDADGLPRVSAAGLKPGQGLRAVWADGHAQVQVDDVTLNGPSPSARLE